MNDFSRWPHQSGHRARSAHALMKRLLAVLLVALIVSPELMQAAIATPELPNPGETGVSKQQQEQIGLKAMSEVYRQLPVLPDSSPIAQYVQQLGRKLEATIPSQYSWPYQFHVVQQKDINAFALPGGPIFVNLGTIVAAGNGAELAGVLAHEMSHIYMQHSIKQQRKTALPAILGGLASAAAGIVGGPVGALGQVGAQVVAGSVIMRYSRADESQADAVGAIIMYKAGYNPKAMADFFQKLEQLSGGSNPPQFLSDHPNPGNRYAAILREIQNWPPKQWAPDTPQFQQAKSLAKNVKAYSAQEIQQRAKSGGGWNNQRPQPVSSRTPAGTSDSSSSMPASSMPAPPSDADAPLPATPPAVSKDYQTLQHQGFTLQYPTNWRSMGDPQSAVTIAPSGGVSQNAIGYGTLIDAFSPRNPKASPSQQVQELIASIRQQNPGLRALGKPQPVTVNGLRGYSLEMMGESPLQGSDGNPLPERDWLVAVPQGQGALLYLVFIAPDRDFSKLRPTFEQILRTLRLQQS